MAISTFATRIREARDELGLSQSEFARQIAHRTKTKVNKSLISQWELGRVKNPQMETMEALVAVTGYSHQYLATGKGPKKADLAASLREQQQAVPLNRAALATALATVLATMFDPPSATTGKAVDVVLSLYDIVAESPGTDTAALRKMARMLLG